jgi:branched-chain amino acid aminotransferase
MDVEAAMAAVLSANSLNEGSLRLTATRGSGPRGIAPPLDPRPTLLITAAPAAPPPVPAACIVATRTRRNEHSPLAAVKSLNALDSILARQEARERGADDAILLNTAGRVAEATAANVFAIVEGRLLTPPVPDGALPGVMRAEVLARGAIEASLTRDDLLRAEAIFLTSSLGIRPVCRIDGHERPVEPGLQWRNRMETPEGGA